jgi:di/tricarboxylate transporter
MGWEAWVTIGVVILLMAGLVRNWAQPDLLAVGCLTLLVAIGSFAGTDKLPSPKDAVAGFGNEGLLTVAVLFVVVMGLVQTSAMTLITQPLIGIPKTVYGAQTRLAVPVMFLSAFLNNTPVVAMFMPVVDDICKKTRISPSKLFIPLSYAAVIGGICTLIGTSTNLIVNGLIISAGMPSMQIFDLAWVGVPCAIGGLAYLLLTSRWLLPERKSAFNFGDDPRQYTVEMIVEPHGPLVGQTIEKAGLRHLPGLYLAEIERNGEILSAVGPHERLHADDRLVFVGVVESVVDLRKIRGIRPATNQTFKLEAPRTKRCLIEAVVSDRCPLIGKSIREGQFRTRYSAAVIAVARSGKRVEGKIGDIVLQPGDTLLLEAHNDFVQERRNSKDFFLVSRVENSAPPRNERAGLALLILAAMVLSVAMNWIDILPAGLLAACLMILTRCCTGPEARQSIEWPVLVVIGASLGIGKALQTSGAAQVIAQNLINLGAGNPWTVLAVVYAVTMVFTELITNNAAAVLVFPIALSSAQALNVNFTPFAIAIMIAASCGFATPIGYQTHMMVYGPGGYRFTDFLKIGAPLDLICMVITVCLTPLVFPF